MTTWTITDDGKKKTSELIAECKKHFPMWCVWNDEELDKHFPRPKKATTRHFPATVEAEDEKGKSYNDLVAPETYCTLRERLIMELQYFKETGENLDKDNWTLCAGSRTAGGSVPSVCLNGDGRVGVSYWSVGAADGDLRFRRVISPSPTSSLPDTLVINNVTYKRQ